MKNSEINIRDPYVLVYDNKYYLYGTRGNTCWGKADGFDVYVGIDLENWEEYKNVFHNDGDFWADRNYWAPEVYKVGDSFYMFASFKSETRRRGTQILKSDSPIGSFYPISDGPVTPEEWECLDGTLYFENNKPYMVFCHEHRQVIDGEMCLLPLSDDFSHALSEPILLFHASDSPYVVPLENGHEITDGPFFYRCENGELLMIWSSFGKSGYLQAVARSKSGKLEGPWTHEDLPLFEKDGGHGMLFKGLDGKMYLTLHAPNQTLQERPVFFAISEKDGHLVLE